MWCRTWRTVPDGITARTFRRSSPVGLAHDSVALFAYCAIGIDWSSAREARNLTREVFQPIVDVGECLRDRTRIVVVVVSV